MYVQNAGLFGRLLQVGALSKAIDIFRHSFLVSTTLPPWHHQGWLPSRWMSWLAASSCATVCSYWTSVWRSSVMLLPWAGVSLPDLGLVTTKKPLLVSGFFLLTFRPSRPR